MFDGYMSCEELKMTYREWFLHFINYLLNNNLSIIPNRLWRNKDFILIVIKTKIYYHDLLLYISDEMRNEPEIILCMIEQHINALNYANESVLSNRNFMLMVMKRKGTYLKFLKSEFQDDYEMVQCAIKSDPYALEFASPRLRSNRNLVLEAVKMRGLSLKFADPILQSDEEIILFALLSDPLRFNL